MKKSDQIIYVDSSVLLRDLHKAFPEHAKDIKYPVCDMCCANTLIKHDKVPVYNGSALCDPCKIFVLENIDSK